MRSKASKSFRTTIFRDGATCFIAVPFDPVPVFGKVRAPVRVTLNGYTYRSTIASMGDGPCVPLRKSHREAAGVEGGETLRVTLELDSEVREVVPPADLLEALRAKPSGWTRWQALSYTQQREHAEAIESAKKSETRQRRVARALEQILAAPKPKPKPKRAGRAESAPSSRGAASRVQRSVATGDDCMRRGKPREAQRAYHEAWSKADSSLEPKARVWLLLAIANAAIRAEDFEDALAACVGALEGFSKTKIVVGNPLFHLFVGIASHALGQHEQSTDNLARALICGGPALFAEEDPRHLRHVKKILRPPAELGTWNGYEGCSRDLLNGASGYLAELLERRLGQPPPYH